VGFLLTELGRVSYRSRLIIAAMEGALILYRIRRSTRPILDVVKLL
jgi:hypothetical protein